MSLFRCNKYMFSFTWTGLVWLLTNFNPEAHTSPNYFHYKWSPAAVVRDQTHSKQCSKLTSLLGLYIMRTSSIYVTESASLAVCLTFRSSRVVLLQCRLCFVTGEVHGTYLHKFSQWDTYNRVACDEEAYQVTNTGQRETHCLLSSYIAMYAWCCCTAVDSIS